jgi:hypothetical protein
LLILFIKLFFPVFFHEERSEGSAFSTLSAQQPDLQLCNELQPRHPAWLCVLRIFSHSNQPKASKAHRALPSRIPKLKTAFADHCRHPAHNQDKRFHHGAAGMRKTSKKKDRFTFCSLISKTHRNIYLLFSSLPTC